jgi:hypothetical protein
MGNIMKVLSFFPRMVNDDENAQLFKEISSEELVVVMSSFQKEKSLGSDGWPIEFFIDLYDVVGLDLLRMVEEVQQYGRISRALNSTFLALIPKVNKSDSFEGFRPISLCNCAFKIISKILAMRIKPLLSKYITPEQFGFLEGRLIHEAIGSAQEALHSIKVQSLSSFVLKLDLSKAYDRVSWTFLDCYYFI